MYVIKPIEHDPELAPYLQDLPNATPSPLPPDHHEAFFRALASPTLLEQGGLTHAVYRFNEHRTDETNRPLLINPVYLLPSASRLGARNLFAITAELNRPVWTIDYPGLGRTSTPNLHQLARLSLRKLSADRAAVVEKILPHDDIDLAGMCMGGTIAACMAQQLEDRVKNLILCATPGFEPRINFHTGLLEQIIQEANDPVPAVPARSDFNSIPIDGTNFSSTAKRTRSRNQIKMRLGACIGQNNFRNFSEMLSSTTTVHDLTGELDRATKPQDHIKILPPSVRKTVLRDQDHGWIMKTIPTAKLLEDTLSSSHTK